QTKVVAPWPAHIATIGRSVPAISRTCETPSTRRFGVDLAAWDVMALRDCCAFSNDLVRLHRPLQLVQALRPAFDASFVHARWQTIVREPQRRLAVFVLADRKGAPADAI